VHWPQVAPALAAAWFVTYLLCLWDVETLVLIVPPGGETLALRIFNFLHYGHNAQVNALCLVLLALAVAPLLLFWTGRILRGAGRRRGDAEAARIFQHPNIQHPTSNIQHPAPHRIAPSSMFRVGCWVFDVLPPDSGRAAPALVRCGWIERLVRLAHHSRSEIRASSRRLLPAMLIAALVGSGCSRNSEREAPIQSHVFSRVQVIGSRGAGLGQFNKPRSLAVDAQDNLYVVDMTGRVQKFSSEGIFLSYWQMEQTDKGKPKGMCRDKKGNIIVVEPHYSRVNHFSTDGKLVAQWGAHGTNAGQLAFPRAAAVTSHGDVFVSEYGITERVQHFAAEGGGLLGVLGRAGAGNGEFNRAEGLCVDAKDRLYVADSCNHRIQVFSPEGRFVRTFGRAGTGPGQLSYPYDIGVDAAGRQYVCEFGNSRIQIFDANDQPLEILGGPGAKPGQFSNPWGIALDSKGNLYVADSMNHRVQKFIHREGEHARIGAPVSGPWSVVRNQLSANLGRRFGSCQQRMSPTDH